MPQTSWFMVHNLCHQQRLTSDYDGEMYQILITQD